MFQALKVLETGKLLVLFSVKIFGFLKIFILGASLSLNLESREKPPGKIVPWKKKPKSLIERLLTPHFVFQ